MTTLRFDDLRQYSDVLRSRSGNPVTVRFLEPRDAGVEADGLVRDAWTSQCSEQLPLSRG